MRTADEIRAEVRAEVYAEIEEARVRPRASATAREAYERSPVHRARFRDGADVTRANERRRAEGRPADERRRAEERPAIERHRAGERPRGVEDLRNVRPGAELEGEDTEDEVLARFYEERARALRARAWERRTLSVSEETEL